jgi:hypothetical protein
MTPGGGVNLMSGRAFDPASGIAVSCMVCFLRTNERLGDLLNGLQLSNTRCLPNRKKRRKRFSIQQLIAGWAITLLCPSCSSIFPKMGRNEQNDA